MSAVVAAPFRHLIRLDRLDRETLTDLLDRAAVLARRPSHTLLANRNVGLLFFEASTRTRLSFELAARRMGARVITIDIANSSRVKGETDADTALTMKAMGFDALVIRSRDDDLHDRLAERVGDAPAIINAGAGRASHPTQALADLMTMRRRKPLDQLSVAIVGDLANSRVARSLYRGLKIAGCRDIRLVAPRALSPASGEYPEAQVTHRLDEGLRGADVVVTLRIQLERMGVDDVPDLDGYRSAYQINRRTLSMAKPGALVMHPGPMNRGVEISDAVADGEQSAILEQVSHGVAVRMAVLEMLARYHGWSTEW